MEGRRLRGGTIAAVALALSAVVGAPAAAKAPAGQEDGPYAVGMRSYTFVDESRPTSPNGSYPGAPDRTLRTLLLYPAEGSPGAPAVEDATPLEAKRRGGFPLVVFSHGFTANGPVYRFLLLDRLVSEGFVVAAPTFPLSSGGAPGGPRLADYVNQPADVSFVLDEVLRLAREDRSLKRTISGHDVGVAGHSLGAITTLGVATHSCCVDPRIDAAVAISGIQLPFPGGSYFSTRTPPLMLIHGESDRTVAYGGSANAYEQAPSPKAFLTLEDAPHTPFFAPWLDPTIRTITDFFDGYLTNDHRALGRLPAEGNVPGVSSLQSDLKG